MKEYTLIINGGNHPSEKETIKATHYKVKRKLTIFFIGNEKILSVNNNRVDGIILKEYNPKELLRKAKIDNITK